jgi:7-cyano-7-deazaguanine synthase in queuosine biosynthesis
MMTDKAIILLSGGLDSLVSLDIAIKKYDVVNSLTFDYGQKAFKEEKDLTNSDIRFPPFP